MSKHQIRFGCCGRELVFLLDVSVTNHPDGETLPWITWSQYARYRELAAEYGGEVPLTPEEYDALLAGDPGWVARLASSPGSNLHSILGGTHG